jgi:hypothetical protein
MRYFFFFFLNRAGCKHPKFSASIKAVGNTITKRPEKDRKLQPRPELSTEDLASILERDQVQIPFSRRPTSDFGDGRRPSTGDESTWARAGGEDPRRKREAGGSG